MEKSHSPACRDQVSRPHGSSTSTATAETLERSSLNKYNTSVRSQLIVQSLDPDPDGACLGYIEWLVLILSPHHGCGHTEVAPDPEIARVQEEVCSAEERCWTYCDVVAVMSSSPHLLTACGLLHSSTDLAQLSIIICTNLHSLPQESCRQESSCGWCWPRPGWSAVWPPASTSSASASPPSHSCWELSWWFYTKLTFDQISWLGLPGLSNSSQNSSIGNPYSKDFLHALNVKAEPPIPYSAVVII